VKILVAGESWVKHIIHIKGFDTFTNSEYEEGIGWFREAMESMDINMDFIPNHDAPEKFPTTIEELKQYDVVFLSDIGSNTLLLSQKTFSASELAPNRLNLIKEYVSDGGGFAMVGGYMSFQGIDGKARYKDTEIEEILPVTMLPYDDRLEAPDGIHIEIVDKNHKILDGIPEKWPHFLGYNKLKIKPNARLIAQHNDNAFIAVSDYNKGRTLSFASDFAPHWGPKEFVNWEYYKTFWVNAVTWLAGNN
jgi:uncharacterized membrane protein